MANFWIADAGRDLAPRAPQTLDLIDSSSAPKVDAAEANGLSDYLGLLKRRKWAVLGFTVLGLGIGFAAMVFQPPLYRARTTVEIQSLNEHFMRMTEVDPQAGAGNYSATDATLQTQIKTLESNLLRNRVVEKVERQTVPLAPPQNDIVAVIRNRLNLAPREPIEATRLAIQKGMKTLFAGVLRSTRIVEIRSDSTSPEVAANLVNTLANEYMDQTVEARVKSTQRTRQWLSKELGDLKTRLEESESRLHDYVRRAGLMFVEQQNTLADAKLKQLQTELSAIQADRIAKQARFEMAARSPADALPDVLDDSMLRSYQTTLADLNRQAAELGAAVTPDHPRAKKIQAQVAELERAQDKARKSILQRIRNEYESAMRRERLLDYAYRNQSQKVTQQAERELQYNILKRETEINRQMYNSTLAQVNQAELASGIPNTNVRVLDVATPPALPFQPDPLTNLGAGSAGGLFLGCAFVIWRGRSDRSLRAPGHATQLLRAPELTVIPNASFTPERRRPLIGMLRPRGRFAVELATWQRSPSLMAESFRICLPALIQGTRGGTPRVVVVTSPAPGEGKTTCAANLAIALAETNRRVLLVDGDFRSPRMHKLFALSGSGCFAEIIDGDQRIDDVSLDALCQPTEVPGLFVLPCQSADINLSRLHYSPRTRELFERLRIAFDIVIVDTPPILQFFDARALAQLSDGVVLVFRAGSTDRESVIAAGHRLEQDGTPLLGTILNDWDPSTAAPKKYHRAYTGRRQHAR
jgi:capsular exopolysaccharide synthesis family protein